MRLSPFRDNYLDAAQILAVLLALPAALEMVDMSVDSSLFFSSSLVLSATTPSQSRL